MSEFIPELSLLLVASQKGHISVVHIVRSDFECREFNARVISHIPFLASNNSQPHFYSSTSSLPPDLPMLGFFVRRKSRHVDEELEPLDSVIVTIGKTERRR